MGTKLDAEIGRRASGARGKPPQLSQGSFSRTLLAITAQCRSRPHNVSAPSRRYWLRTLGKWGEGGLGMSGIQQRSKGKRDDSRYSVCRGQSPLTGGRVPKCASHRVRAARLAAGVWKSLSELLQTPPLLPQLHVSWAQTKQHTVTALTAQLEQLQYRKQRVERQSERLLDAYQAEIITLKE